MKTHELLHIASLLIGISLSTVINAATYSGNGNSGFGGAIGTSSLVFADDGISLSLGLTRGSGQLNDTFVLYLDSTAGGISNNTTITDSSDSFRQAISGCSESCVNINFGINADYAIAFDATIGATLFGIESDGSLVHISNLGGSGTNTDTSYSFDLFLSDIGLASSSGQSIRFVGTYINHSNSYLSNEGYGAGLPSGNPGFTSVTFTGYEQYETSTVTPPPDTPANVTATDGTYTDKVRVTWDDVSDEDSYDVYRCLTTSTDSCSLINSPTANTTSYDDTGANADGIVYYYRIRACSDANGCSGISDPDSGNRARIELIFTDGFES